MSLTPAQASSPGSPTENLAGLVERVTFHNEDNGFCVLRLKARGQRDLVTVIGHAAMISAGEWIQATGTWTNDRTHGLQFRAAFLKATPPTTIEGFERYLGSGIIRGIGPTSPMRNGRRGRRTLLNQSGYISGSIRADHSTRLTPG